MPISSLYLSIDLFYNVNIGSIIIAIASIYFLLYGLSPYYCNKFFGLNSDKDVVSETKKDLQLIAKPSKKWFRKFEHWDKR